MKSKWKMGLENSAKGGGKWGGVGDSSRHKSELETCLPLGW